MEPSDKSRVLLDQVLAVLDEYADYLPLTIRQVFYRLVARYFYAKDERAYGRLVDMMNRARRAKLISMYAIRDDGGVREDPRRWRDAQQYLARLRSSAEQFQLDRSQGQPVRLVVVCEAGGMVPQLFTVSGKYGITAMSAGGFDSTTDRHNFAQEVVEGGRPTEVLHIGDYDPSGAHMFLALMEDIQAFAEELGGDISFTRLAVTPEQISDLRLPTQPKKATDRRAFGTDWTCQAEAIAPDVMAQIVRDAIEERIDPQAYRLVLSKEKREPALLIKKLK